MPDLKNNNPKQIRKNILLRNATSRQEIVEMPQLANGRNKLRSKLEWNSSETYIPKFRLDLYRFLRDNIPVLGSCIWTWSRLAAAPSRFEVLESKSDKEKSGAELCLEDLALRIYPYRYHKMAGCESFLPMLFNTLFTDGAFAGLVVLDSDGGGIDRFMPLETGLISSRPDNKGDKYLVYHSGEQEYKLEDSEFYYFGLDADANQGLGQSILKAVPFVAYIEQQLVDDMRRAVHNAGYHRLHVQISPPEKLSGEADSAYVDRVNDYFDETVSMIKSCEAEDNPVTWDNVKIDYIGPKNVSGVGNSWFLNHRTMIEEICAGTNLSPFMLGYSYGTTHNWAQFKYDLVMRQVVSIQRQTSRFMEWLGNIELALKGFDCRCRFVFDNRFSHNAVDRADIRKADIDNILKLYQAGLIGEDTARVKAEQLI